MPALGPIVAEYVAALPPGARCYACLRLGWLDRVALAPEWQSEFLPLLADGDPAIRGAAQAVLDRHRTLRPDLWRWLMLKLGRETEVGTKPHAIGQVLAGLDDADGDVRAAAGRYLRSLPDDAATNELVFGHWLRQDNPALRVALRDSGRVAPGVPVRALFCLLTGQIEAYLRLGDTDGEAFRGAWVLASSAQRREVNAAILRSHHDDLIRSYELAMSGRADYDLELHVQALLAGGQDEMLWALSGRLNLGQFLRVCSRWEASGWRPPRPEDGALIDEALRLHGAWREAADELGPPPPLPGTVDVLARWRDATLDQRAAQRQALEPEPLARAGASYALARHAAPPPGGETQTWLERLAAAVNLPPLAPEAPDHVVWVNVARGWHDELRLATLRSTPDQYDTTRQTLAWLERQRGPLPARLRSLCRVLERLQRYFGTGVEVFVDDEPADPAAIEVAAASVDAVLAEVGA